MSGPRVLQLINGEYFGGSARVLVNYLSSRRREANVVVGTVFDGELARRCRELGVPTELVPMRSRTDMFAVRTTLQLARRYRVDLIHTHQVRNTLLGRLTSAIGGWPVVTHVHSPAFRESTSGVRNWLTGSVDRLFAGRTASFIAVSQSLAAEMVSQGIPRDRIQVVHNGIELPGPPAAHHRDDVRKEFAVAASDAMLGMVANLRPRKGAESLIQAVGILQDRGYPVRLLLIGQTFREAGRDYSSELRSLAARLHVGERVLMTGFRSDTTRLLSALDLFVLPSLFGEGLPMALLEAMALQRPVVATPVEGIPEVIADGENGLLAPPADPVALAAAIGRLLDDPGLGTRLGLAAQRTVTEGYSADRMTEGIEAIYSRVLRGGQDT